MEYTVLQYPYSVQKKVYFLWKFICFSTQMYRYFLLPKEMFRLLFFPLTLYSMYADQANSFICRKKHFLFGDNKIISGQLPEWRQTALSNTRDLCTLNYILHTLNYIDHIHCKLDHIHCKLYHIHCKLDPIQCKLYPEHCKLDLYTVNYILHTVN